MDRIASQTDAAFRAALGGNFSGLDSLERLIAEEKARRTPFDRLHSLLAYHRVAGSVDAEILAQSRRHVSGEYRVSVSRRYEGHRVAVKCLRRRIERMVRRGRA